MKRSLSIAWGAWLWAGSLFTTGAAVANASSNDASLQQLRLEKYVLPEFPEFVRQTGASRGVVTVAIGRNPEGYVDDVLVLDSTHPKLAYAVTTAVQEWRFARPANPPPPGRQIVPIVRFLFATTGVSVVSAVSGPAGAKSGAPGVDSRPDAPVILPLLSDLDPAPKPLHQPMPVLNGPHPAVDGTATVKFFVDETGRVRVPIVTEATTPAFGEAALAAVREWRYEPPRIGERPTIVIERTTFRFATGR